MFLETVYRSHGKEHDAIVKLLKSRNMPESCYDDLPEIGYIVYSNDKEPIAAGFLRRVEENYGMLDSYISNPERSSEERNKALSMLTGHLIFIARKIGIKKLLAFSSDENTYLRSLKHGFGEMPHKFSLLVLRD